MTGPQVLVLHAQALSTSGLQGWIQDNVIPLILLGIAIILLWIGGKGDNAGVARRSVGLIVGLIALGIAVSGNASAQRARSLLPRTATTGASSPRRARISCEPMSPAWTM